MHDRRPRVFVSSTVHDLGDLRSSLRWWLTEMGYDAQLSEHSAFDKPLDTDSYTACLKAVEDNDYFILIIGNRRGGLVNDAEKISITRAEYRRAYERFTSVKRPQLVTFVRASVWAAYEDRRGIAKVLNADELRAIIPDEVRAKIKNAPSEIVDHPEHTFDFINEAKRLDEIVEAQKLGTPWPAGNWVHVFYDFADIVNVLRSQLRVGPLRQAAVGATLRAELQSIAYPFVISQKSHSRLVPMKDYVAPFRSALTANPFVEDQQMAGPVLQAIAQFMTINGRTTIGVMASAVDSALASGEFLEWNAERHRYELGIIHLALIKLRLEMRMHDRHDAGFKPEWREMLTRWFQMSKQRDPALWQETVPTMLRIMVAALHDRQSNILDLCAALVAAIDGDLAAINNLSLWHPSALTAAKGPYPDDGVRLTKLDACLRDLADRTATAPRGTAPADDT